MQSKHHASTKFPGNCFGDAVQTPCVYKVSGQLLWGCSPNTMRLQSFRATALGMQSKQHASTKFPGNCFGDAVQTACVYKVSGQLLWGCSPNSMRLQSFRATA